MIFFLCIFFGCHFARVQINSLSLGIPNESSKRFVDEYMEFSSQTPKRPKKRNSVALLVSNVPWDYGPYQVQMYKLSLELDKHGWDVHWMCFSQISQMMIDVGPPPGFKHDHLTYHLYDESQDNQNKAMISIQRLNFLSQKHKLNRIIILTDVDRIIRDTYACRVPCSLWMPYHYAQFKKFHTHTLEVFNVVASLAPTATSLMGDSITLTRRYIPHIIEVPKYNEDYVSRKLHGIPENSFLIMAQGGNYETYDRKGWSEILQSFARFHAEYPDSFLYIHSIGARELIQSDHMMKDKPIVQERGVNHDSLLRQLGVPKSSYFITTDIIDIEDAFALKVMADVCLHPSKTEGFGMNVLECQLLGTPVITTDFLAMGDFTKYGIKVPYKKLDVISNGFVASPDVAGLVEALKKVYKNDIDENLKATTQSWIKDHFSAERVGRAFARMLGTMKKRGPPEGFLDVMWKIIKSDDIVVNTELLESGLRIIMQEKENTELTAGIMHVPGFGYNTNIMDLSDTAPFGFLVKKLQYWQASELFSREREKIQWIIQNNKNGKMIHLPENENLVRYIGSKPKDEL